MSDRPHLATLVDDFRRNGNQSAIVSRLGVRKQSTSYAQLAARAGRFAAKLMARGIVKGDRVIIWGENSADWIAAFFGCVLRGVVVVPIDVAGAVTFAQRVIEEVNPKLIVGQREKLDRLAKAPPVLAFEQFIEQLPPTAAMEPAADLSENDTLQIVFTSGTTGDPKGVVHTHRNILASLGPIEHEMQKYLKYERIFHPLRFLHTLPLSHVFGQFMGIWIPPLLAAEVHFESRLIAGDLVELIRRERISVLAAVPRVLEILRSHFLHRFARLDQRLAQARGASAWRRWWIFRDVHKALGFKFWALIAGGATLPEEVESFWSALGLVVIQGYGMTETAALVSLNHPFHPARGTLGRVLPGREIRIGEDGEILVRGETVAQATWEAGRSVKRASEWLATGDLASVDESGNLKFRGRKKDVIVSASGLNIYPEDLEAALLHQPQVRAAAVVETQGPNGGEPMAALVLSGSGDAAAAVRSANLELAEYQQIRRWTVWPDPDLPRTSTGKISRREVSASLQRSAHPDRGGKTAPTGALAAIISRITREDITHLPDSALLSEDLRLDSLGRVELQSALENQYNLQIDDAAYQRVRTLGELRALLQQPESPISGVIDEPVSKDEHIYPLWPWSGVQSAIRVLFIETVMRPIVAFLAAPRVESRLERSPRRPLLIVANHITTYDGALILYALPRPMRHHVAIAMSGEMLLDMRKARGQGNFFVNLIAPIGYLLTTALFNVFPLPQRGNFRASFAHAGLAMDRGFSVLVFPEGRRTEDVAIHGFQGGAGLLWKKVGSDALPIYVGGLAELKSSGAKWFRSRLICVRIGSPIALPPNADPVEATRLLEQAVRELETRL